MSTNFIHTLLLFYSSAFIPNVVGYCEEGLQCGECDLIFMSQACNTFEKVAHFVCNNDTSKVDYRSSEYLMCVDGRMELFDCAAPGMPAEFNPISRQCVAVEEHIFEDFDTFDTESITVTEYARRRKRRSTTGSSRVGDVCAFNTDCQRGMFCGGGICSCLSDFVAISQHCWPKVNPGESGCVESRQCEAVWPATVCSNTGVCECPAETVPSRTREGTICVSALLPPSCPLPEGHNGAPNPSTILANPSTHPLNPGEYMPVLCTSTSSETRVSNGGDGSTWCIYPDGTNDVYIADIYNCISHPQVNNEIFPEYAESVDGVCCHNRAFVCIQPMESGEEPSIPRWWFNSATGTCVQFLWDPQTTSSASPNNFRTVEHCESYCRDTCKRGTMEFTSSKYSILDESPRRNCMAANGKCDGDHTCSLIGSQQTCCPTTASICSAHGGRHYSLKPSENFDRGLLIAGNRATTRYYYDADQGRCINFMYSGLGNFNNFITKQDCESFCSKLICENGNPLRVGEEWQRCETNADCPTSHSCQGGHKVCCPTAQSICTQPKRLGDCTSSVRRYYYNAATRQCEVFQYTGCQGNDNNFATLVQCQQQCRGINVEPKCAHGRAYRERNGSFQLCSDKQGGIKCPINYVCTFDGVAYGCCPTKSFTCSLNPDKGVQCGSGKSYRYYFNSNKQTCETFQYEGCDGNSNNFLNSEECQHYCGVGGCPNGGTPLREEGSNRQTTCSEQKTCPSSHECLSVPFNGNVAYRCCPTKAHICSQPPQQGNHCSKTSLTRFYFNIVTKECAEFQYNGCNGNLNNFASVKDCNNFCSSAGCGVGEIAYKDVNTKKAYDCNNILTNSCPANFQCRFNSLTSGYVCCGSGDMDVCPAEERAYINAVDETVRECVINIPGSCPADFLCRFNAQRNRYYCCAPTTENVCPDGRILYRASKSLLPIRCTMNGQNMCPDGYTCQSRTRDVLQGFCCSSRNICKGDAEALLDDKTRMPRICTPGAFISCPNGYRCHRQTPSSTNGFCCKGDINAVSEGCPPGEYAYSRKSEIVLCDPFNLANKGCPSTFSCQFSVAFQRYQCCGKDPIEEDEIEQIELGCLASQVAYVIDNVPVVCTASGNTCPLGYFCQFSDKNKQFQCCAHKSGCPGESVAYIDLTGSATECSAKFSACPKGYSCQRTRQSRYICCTGGQLRPMSFASLAPSATSNSTEGAITSSITTETVLMSTATTTKASMNPCPQGMIMTNGECKVRGTLGASCLLASQCAGGAECIGLVCACSKKTQQVDGKCVRLSCDPDEIELENSKCVKRVSIGAACEDARQCQNGSDCLGGFCKCTHGTAPFEDRCLANLCGRDKIPTLTSEGGLFVCQKVQCNMPSMCTFSKTIRQYICCSPKETSRIIATPRNAVVSRPRPRVTTPMIPAHKCPNGEDPLLFPSNRLPLVCNASSRCPPGYQCLNRKCCRTDNRRQKRSAACPRNYHPVNGENGEFCVPVCSKSVDAHACSRRRKRHVNGIVVT